MIWGDDFLRERLYFCGGDGFLGVDFLKISMGNCSGGFFPEKETSLWNFPKGFNIFFVDNFFLRAFYLVQRLFLFWVFSAFPPEFGPPKPWSSSLEPGRLAGLVKRWHFSPFFFWWVNIWGKPMGS